MFRTFSTRSIYLGNEHVVHWLFWEYSIWKMCSNYMSYFSYKLIRFHLNFVRIRRFRTINDSKLFLSFSEKNIIISISCCFSTHTKLKIVRNTNGKNQHWNECCARKLTENGKMPQTLWNRILELLCLLSISISICSSTRTSKNTRHFEVTVYGFKVIHNPNAFKFWIKSF